MTRVALVVVAAAVLSWRSTALATMFIPADLGELVSEARAIVHGRVVALEARWTDGRRGIETLVTVAADDYLKGRLGAEVTVRVPGGQVGHYRSFTIGAPSFVEGEEVVLFLDADGPAIPHLVGLSQGVFRVKEDTATGLRVVVPPVFRAPGADGEPVRLVRGDPGRQPVPLEAFHRQVRAMAAGGGQ